MMNLSAFCIVTLVHASITWAFVTNELRGTAFHKRLDTKLYGEVSDEMHENFRKLGLERPKPIRRSAVSHQGDSQTSESARESFQASIKNAYHKILRTPKPIIRRTAVGPRDEESIRDSIMNSFRRPCDIDINADINITPEYYELEFLIEKK